MSNQKCLWGPSIVITGVLALWQNEGRFNYYEAATDATQISSPYEFSGEPISFTSKLDTDIPITGDYIKKFVSYHKVSRRATICSWHKDTDSEGHTTWKLGWHSRLEKNSRNSGLQQKLSSRDLYPSHYILGDMRITKDRIHFVDSPVPISVKSLELTNKAHSLKLRRSGILYLANGKPNKLGDERLRYKGIPNAPTATYFGVISDGTGVGKKLENVTGEISSLIRNDGILHHLVNGEREAALVKMNNDFRRIVWLTRIGGILAIIGGIYLFFRSFLSLFYRIPLLGGLANIGPFVTSLVVGMLIALLVIFTSLMTHNPFSIALPLIIVFAIVAYFIFRSKMTKKQANRILKDRLSNFPPPLPTPHLALDSTLTPRFKTILEPTQPITNVTSSAAASLETPNNNLIEQTFLQLATMIHAEGGLKKKENKLITKWGNKNNISKERMRELFDEAEKCDVQSCPAKRQDLELLVMMALVDGELSAGEWNLLVKFSAQMGLSVLDVRNIIRGVESGELIKL